MAFYPPNTGGGGGGPVTGLTGTPTQVVYIDNAGNGTSDSLFTRNSVTNESYFGQTQSSGVDRAAFELNTNVLGFGLPGVLMSRGDIAGTVGNTIFGILDISSFGGSPYAIIGQATDSVTGDVANFNLQSDNMGYGVDNGSSSQGIFGMSATDYNLIVGNVSYGGDDRIDMNADLNGGSGAQYWYIQYKDSTPVTNSIKTSQEGIRFDYGNFSNTPGTYYVFPQADGGPGQVLTTDGAGNISFAAIPPASAALTATYIGFGDGSNVLTGDSQLTYNSTYSFIKHTVPDNSDSLTYGAASFSGSGLDDFTLTWDSSIYFSNKYGGNLVITIDGTGTPDTFSWSFTGSYSQIIGSGSNIPITGLQQQLQDNFGGNVIAQVQFTATTGHTLSDQWTASTSLGGNQKGYNLADTYGHEQFEVEPNGGTYSLGDDGTNGGSSWWGNGTQLLISDGNGELGLFAPRYLRVEPPSGNTMVLADMQAGVWVNYGEFRVNDVATSSIWFKVDTVSHNINIGDVQSAGNDTLFTVDDNATTMTGTLDGTFTLQAVLGSDFFTLNTTTGNVRLGDISGALNSTNFFIDDQNSEIKGLLDGEFFVADSLSNRVFSADTTTMNVSLGDIDASANGTVFNINDTTGFVTVKSDGTFLVTDTFLNERIRADASGGSIVIQLGDISGTNTGTVFTVEADNYLYKLENGIIRGTDLHNNGNVSQGSATQQDVRSGTYTPTLTNVTNISSSTAYKFQWMRVGNVVTVSGRVNITNTATGASELGISLPVASDIGATTDCVGSAPGSSSGILDDVGWVVGDATNNRAKMESTATNTNPHDHWVSFTYEVI